MRTTIRKINNKKIPKDLDSVLKALTTINSDLYDINCYIFRAEKDFTIVEIQYYKKSNLDRDFAKKVRDNPPMYHAKVSLPPNKRNDLEKFDVNWNNDGII